MAEIAKRRFDPELTTNVQETLNTRFDQVTWTGSEPFIADVELEGQKFRLYVEVGQVPGNKATYLNLAFARVADGKFVQTLVNAGDNPSKVFGAVQHALLDKVKELESKYTIDAIATIAIASETKRLSIYRRLLTPLSFPHNPFVYSGEVETPGGVAIIAMNRNVKLADYQEIQADLAKNGKNLIPPAHALE